MDTLDDRLTVLSIDPTEQLGHLHPRDILQQTGVLVELLGGSSDLGKNLENNYIFFCVWTKADSSWHVSEDLFCYTGDPVQYPLVKIESRTHTALIYLHDIVVITDKSTGISKFTRAD